MLKFCLPNAAKLLSVLLCLLAAPGAFCNGPAYDFPFRNTSLPWSERVADLVKRLNISEVIAQLTRGGIDKNGPAPAIPRLGIDSYQWNTECLHGVAEAGKATSFPQAIGLSASFDPDLLWRVANATGAEARAKFIDNKAHGRNGDHTGMSCFAPVVNIMRQPLWGRNQETYGEDTFLSSMMARAFVTGLQGNLSTRFLQATATCKHFAAHCGPEDIPVNRLSFNSVVSSRDLTMTFFPTFEACISAGAQGVMCSYNSLNGQPACANHWLLTRVLREAWSFPGYVVSDEGALEYMVTFHHRYSNFLDAAVAAIDAGVNLELAPVTNKTVYSTLSQALARKLVNESRLRELVAPLFETRMRLGEFDPREDNPYAAFRASDLVQSAAHRQLSLQAAVRSFVLLKHRDAFLPWKVGMGPLVLLGPFSNQMDQLYGDYAADRSPEFEVTIEAGLRKLANITTAFPGCLDGPKCQAYASAEVQSAVANAQLIVLTVGTGQVVESENIDRVSLELPNKQSQLLEDVLHHSPASARVLLLVFSATPVAINLAVTSAKVKAILWCGFPGQTAGSAVAAAIATKSASMVAGRLPFTWYADDGQLPSRTDYHMHNQTYRYLPPEIHPLFSFGFGLSLTQFHYDGLGVPSRLSSHLDMRVTVRVTNVGHFDGEEVVQVYISWPATEKEMPRLQMVAFQRTNLIKPKESVLLSFAITPAQRRVWRNEGLRAFLGRLSVFVGGQQPDQKTRAPSNVLRATCDII